MSRERLAFRNLVCEGVFGFGGGAWRWRLGCGGDGCCVGDDCVRGRGGFHDGCVGMVVVVAVRGDYSFGY